MLAVACRAGRHCTCCADVAYGLGARVHLLDCFGPRARLDRRRWAHGRFGYHDAPPVVKHKDEAARVRPADRVQEDHPPARPPFDLHVRALCVPIVMRAKHDPQPIGVAHDDRHQRVGELAAGGLGVRVSVAVIR